MHSQAQATLENKATLSLAVIPSSRAPLPGIAAQSPTVGNRDVGRRCGDYDVLRGVHQRDDRAAGIINRLAALSITARSVPQYADIARQQRDVGMVAPADRCDF